MFSKAKTKAKAKALNTIDSAKLTQSSKILNNDSSQPIGSKLTLDQSEALAISKYIIDKVLLPKILGKPAVKKEILGKPTAKKGKDEPKPPNIPEPDKPLKQTVADARKNATKTLPIRLRPKRLYGVQKNISVRKEPTHKDQFTMTDDLNETVAKAAKSKATKRSTKVKPKSASPAIKKSTTVAKEKTDRIERIGEANIEKISGKSADITTSDIQGDNGGGDEGLIISEITVKFCRRN